MTPRFKTWLHYSLVTIFSLAIFVWWLTDTQREIAATGASDTWRAINEKFGSLAQQLEASGQLLQNTTTQESVLNIQQYLAASSSATTTSSQ